MHQVNIHEAKTHLSRLVERAAAGEEIIIAKAGKPQARLVPLVPKRKPRVLGLFEGQHYYMAPDFDELPADMATAFEGEEL